MMLDVVPGWQRVKPSGFVHLMVKADPSSGLREMACGTRRMTIDLTEDFPPYATRCRKCEAAS